MNERRFASTRRTFLLSLIGIGVVPRAALAEPASATVGSGSKVPLRPPDFLRSIRGFEDLGQDYLEQHPAERDESLLIRAILPELEGFSGSGFESSALRARLRARIRREFEVGELVRVRYWLLSRAEARLYALLHLSSS